MADEVAAIAAPAAAAPPVAPAQAANNGALGEIPNKAPVANAEPELHEVKINGQIRKMTLEQLRAEASLGGASRERFDAAARKEKEITDFAMGMSKDPIGSLLKAGFTPAQVREKFESWYMENVIAPETMTAEQKQAAEWKRKAEAWEAKEKEEEDTKQNQAKEKFDNEVREQMQQQLISCIEKSGLPKTRFVLNRMAYWTQQNIRNKFDAPEEVIIKQVRDEMREVSGAAVADRKADPEKLVEFLIEQHGEDLIKAIRKYDLKRLKTKFGQPSDDGSPNSPTGKKGESIPMRKVDEYFNNLRRSK